MKRFVLIAAAAIAGVVVLASLWLWLFFDANQFRPRLEAALGGAVGRKVTLGTIHLSALSGSIAIDDVAIGDDPAFGAEPFILAKRVSVGVDLMPLVLSRTLRVESFRLDRPRVTLLRSPAGKWNFSGLAAAGGSTSSGPGMAAGALVQKITVSNGQLVVGRTGSRSRPRVYDDVAIDISNLSLTSSFPFSVNAKTPGGGTLALKGTAGPVNPADAALTPLDASAEIKRLDLAATGFVDPSAGVSGVADFSGTVHSDGGVITSKGRLSASRMQLVPGGAPARVPIEVDYESAYTSKTQRGVLKQGDVHVGKAAAHLTGEYDLAGDTPAVRMKLSGASMAATELQAALPAVGIALPSGASFRQGTADTTLAIGGPIDRLVMTGPVSLSNAVIAGFDVGAKLAPILALAGVPQPGATTIQTLASALRVAPDGIRFDNMNLVVPTIGTITGSGTISPQHALDFRMVAKLVSTIAAAGSLARITSLGQPGNGIPFRIEGTSSAPVFVPDVGRAVQSAITSEETKKKAGDLLGRLLGRSK